MSWPEEMSFIANSSKMDRHKGRLMCIKADTIVVVLNVGARD